MSKIANIVVVIHGITPLPKEEDIFYGNTDEAKFIKDLSASLLASKRVDEIIPIQWGHPKPGLPNPNNAEFLMAAENNILAKVKYIFGGILDNLNIYRRTIKTIQEKIINLGVSDMIYYCGVEGEKAIRSYVYKEILQAVGSDKYSSHDEIRLHLTGHSLGITLAHDFLYGLFGKNPDFCLTNADSEACQLFEKWRGNKRLVLGSLSAMASQLPILVMRRQKLVDLFFSGGELDPQEIGILGGKTRWKIFYDADDILGFKTKGLYKRDDGINEMQVNNWPIHFTSSFPFIEINAYWQPMVLAHTGYWRNRTVIEEIIALINSNAA